MSPEQQPDEVQIKKEIARLKDEEDRLWLEKSGAKAPLDSLSRREYYLSKGREDVLGQSWIAPAIASITGHVQGRKSRVVILDLGTGTGLFAEALSDQLPAVCNEVNISTCDVDLKSLRSISKPEIHRIRSEITTPPFPVRTFDVVASTLTLHEIGSGDKRSGLSPITADTKAKVKAIIQAYFVCQLDGFIVILDAEEEAASVLMQHQIEPRFIRGGELLDFLSELLPEKTVAMQKAKKWYLATILKPNIQDVETEVAQKATRLLESLEKAKQDVVFKALGELMRREDLGP